MIVYKITDGLALDLRYEEDLYILKSGERSIKGWGSLPAVDSLSDPDALAARAKAHELERLRVRALRAIDDRRLAAALSDPTAPQEVKDYAAVVLG